MIPTPRPRMSASGGWHRPLAGAGAATRRSEGMPQPDFPHAGFQCPRPSRSVRPLRAATFGMFQFMRFLSLFAAVQLRHPRRMTLRADRTACPHGVIAGSGRRTANPLTVSSRSNARTQRPASVHRRSGGRTGCRVTVIRCPATRTQVLRPYPAVLPP